jgi:heme-degrading monooxygenase HmoA
MYARVLWGKIKMGMWDEYERYYDQKIISSTEGVKGFRGRRLLRSLENPDEGISISLWETKEDMENYVKSPRRQELARDAEKLYSGEYWVKHFEVKSSNG